MSEMTYGPLPASNYVHFPEEDVCCGVLGLPGHVPSDIYLRRRELWLDPSLMGECAFGREWVAAAVDFVQMREDILLRMGPGPQGIIMRSGEAAREATYTGPSSDVSKRYGIISPCPGKDPQESHKSPQAQHIDTITSQCWDLWRTYRFVLNPKDLLSIDYKELETIRDRLGWGATKAYLYFSKKGVFDPWPVVWTHVQIAEAIGSKALTRLRGYTDTAVKAGFLSTEWFTKDSYLYGRGLWPSWGEPYLASDPPKLADLEEKAYEASQWVSGRRHAEAEEFTALRECVEVERIKEIARCLRPVHGQNCLSSAHDGDVMTRGGWRIGHGSYLAVDDVIRSYVKAGKPPSEIFPDVPSAVAHEIWKQAVGAIPDRWASREAPILRYYARALNIQGVTASELHRMTYTSFKWLEAQVGPQEPGALGRDSMPFKWRRRVVDYPVDAFLKYFSEQDLPAGVRSSPQRVLSTVWERSLEDQEYEYQLSDVWHTFPLPPSSCVLREPADFVLTGQEFENCLGDMSNWTGPYTDPGGDLFVRMEGRDFPGWGFPGWDLGNSSAIFQIEARGVVQWEAKSKYWNSEWAKVVDLLNNVVDAFLSDGRYFRNHTQRVAWLVWERICGGCTTSSMSEVMPYDPEQLSEILLETLEAEGEADEDDLFVIKLELRLKTEADIKAVKDYHPEATIYQRGDLRYVIVEGLVRWETDDFVLRVYSE